MRAQRKEKSKKNRCFHGPTLLFHSLHHAQSPHPLNLTPSPATTSQLHTAPTTLITPPASSAPREDNLATAQVRVSLDLLTALRIFCTAGTSWVHQATFSLQLGERIGGFKNSLRPEIPHPFVLVFLFADRGRYSSSSINSQKSV